MIMQAGNAALYAPRGSPAPARRCALGGVLALWSADRSAAFEALLGPGRADWRVVETPAAAGRPEPLHALYFCDLSRRGCFGLWPRALRPLCRRPIAPRPRRKEIRKVVSM